MNINELSVGLIGGTGEEGRGLALRWAAAGARVSIGSRTLERAKTAADELNLSIRTIETYRTRIMKKCGVTKFSDAISIFSVAQRGRSI